MSINKQLAVLNSLVNETAGCGFNMYCNGVFWTIYIPKSGFRSHGIIAIVLKETIAEIKAERSIRKTSNKTYKKYIYN